MNQERVDLQDTPGYRLIPHPADIGLEFWGDTLEEAFVQAAKGLAAMLGGEGEIRRRAAVRISLEGADRLELLFNWLSELLVYFDGEQLLLNDFEIERLSDNAIVAEGRGETYDPLRHDTPYYVKAITYHQLELEEREGQWHGRVFLDI